MALLLLIMLLQIICYLIIAKYKCFLSVISYLYQLIQSIVLFAPVL